MARRSKRRSKGPADPAAFRPKKLFTVEQANRMLPLVRRIVEDIRSAYLRLTEKVQRTPGLWDNEAGASPAHREELDAVRAELEANRDQLVEYAAELDRLGVYLKDETKGLVDFPSLHEGRVVFLCWMLDEPTVGHWHDLDSGFAGRQSIDIPADFHSEPAPLE